VTAYTKPTYPKNTIVVFKDGSEHPIKDVTRLSPVNKLGDVWVRPAKLNLDKEKV